MSKSVATIVLTGVGCSVTALTYIGYATIKLKKIIQEDAIRISEKQKAPKKKWILRELYGNVRLKRKEDEKYNVNREEIEMELGSWGKYR